MAVVVTKETLKDIKIDDIMLWCQENKQVPWLKEIGSTMVEQPIYPTITYFDKNGKERTKYDKKQEPIGTETVHIPFVTIKYEWVKTFFPELAPQPKEKKAKKTLWDRIAELEEI